MYRPQRPRVHQPEPSCPSGHLLGGQDYTVNQASYDLARLRDNQLIRRRAGTNTYDLTADGLRVAIFYTKIQDRVLRPLLAVDQPPPPPQIRTALHTIETHINVTLDHARLGKAA